MNAVAELLPANSDVFELALAEAMSDALDVPYADIMDPAKTPAEFLPFLAAHKSVDLWYSDWPEARKRQMVAEAEELASLVGTVAAAPRFLSFVDTIIIHKVGHPARHPVGQIAAGITPVNHQPFVARYLLKTDLVVKPFSSRVGQSVVGKKRDAVRTIDREPLNRAKKAITLSKIDGTAYSVTFAHRELVTLDDGFDLDTDFRLGKYKDRIRL